MTQPLPDQVPAAEPDPLDVIAQANDLASLDEELNQLPQKYRDVLVMSYFAQQTNQEIADQLNESKGAIDGRIRDARRILRVRLARRGVEVGVLTLATAYVQSSASAASPALIQKAISLGAPGMVSQELAALNAAEVAQMKLLTSTGIPIMSKIGLTIAGGLILATGVWGMSHLAAFQDAGGGAGASADAESAGDDVNGEDDATEINASAAPTKSIDAFNGGVEATIVAMTETSANEEDATPAPTTTPRRPLTGAAAEFSRRSERDAERRLNEIMQTERVVKMNFPGENPITDVLIQLENLLSESQGKPIAIRPDIGALEEDSIVLADVMIKDIEIPNNLMTVGSTLDYIFSQTDPQLTWIAKDELLLITTVAAAEAEENMFLRSYDITRVREISQLTATVWMRDGQPASSGGGGGGFFSMHPEPTQSDGVNKAAVPQTTMTQPSKKNSKSSETKSEKQDLIITWEAGLMQTIQELTSPPCQWHAVDGEGGKMSLAGNRLIVRQSRRGHEQVVAVLELLEMAAEDIAAEAAK